MVSVAALDRDVIALRVLHALEYEHGRIHDRELRNACKRPVFIICIDGRIARLKRDDIVARRRGSEIDRIGRAGRHADALSDRIKARRPLDGQRCIGRKSVPGNALRIDIDTQRRGALFVPDGKERRVLRKGHVLRPAVAELLPVVIHAHPPAVERVVLLLGRRHAVQPAADGLHALHGRRIVVAEVKVDHIFALTGDNFRPIGIERNVGSNGSAVEDESRIQIVRSRCPCNQLVTAAHGIGGTRKRLSVDDGDVRDLASALLFKGDGIGDLFEESPLAAFIGERQDVVGKRRARRAVLVLREIKRKRSVGKRVFARLVLSHHVERETVPSAERNQVLIVPGGIIIHPGFRTFGELCILIIVRRAGREHKGHGRSDGKRCDQQPLPELHNNTSVQFDLHIPHRIPPVRYDSQQNLKAVLQPDPYARVFCHNLHNCIFMNSGPHFFRRTVNALFRCPAGSGKRRAAF